VAEEQQGPARQWLETHGVKTRNCDLLGSLEQLPEAANLVYLVGLKFGTAQNPAATWAGSGRSPVMPLMVYWVILILPFHCRKMNYRMQVFRLTVPVIACLM